MKKKFSLEKLLRWRLKYAESVAPPAPSAARLLELTRPWWENRPEKYRMLVRRLGHIQIVGGHAMSGSNREGRPVPALVVRGDEITENYAQVQEFGVQKTTLCLRFQMEKKTASLEPAFEATFISDTTTRPLFCADGTVLARSQYRIDADLPPVIARDWKKLELQDRLPFWLILFSGTGG